MNLPTQPHRSFVKRDALFCASLLAALLAGCASPGTPRPPSLKLPEQVTDLTAIRIGDRVDFSWTTPTRTTDKVDINFPTTVEICRDPLPATPPAPRRLAPVPCTPVLHAPAHAGASTATDILPASLTSAARAPIAYRIRVLNPAGRSADPSPPVFIATGPAEPPVHSFRAIQTGRGVVLDWTAPAAGSIVEVTRTLVQPVAPTPTAKTAPKGPAIGKRQDPKDPVHLRPARQANGMLDPSPIASLTYIYIAQSISLFKLQGHELELRSEPTPPLTVALRDTFPPAPPRGLVSIPGTLAAHPTLDLSWDPNTESDLAGYRVYRLDLATPNATPQRLTPETLLGPAFRDATVVPGHRYRYTVTALDRTGNESLPSVPIDDTAVAP